MKINEAFYLRHETWGSVQNWLLAKYSPVTIWNSYNMGLINLWIEGLLSVSWVNISERAKLVIPDLPGQRNHLGRLLRMLLFSHWVMSDSAVPWTAARQASLSFTVSWSLLRLMSIESVRPSNHLILCCPLLLPSVFPSIRSFPVSRLFASGGQSIGAPAWRASPKAQQVKNLPAVQETHTTSV